MDKNVNVNLGSLKSKAQKLLPVLAKHASFIAVIAVLLVYLFVVFRISQLAGAEPPADQDITAAAAIPKVDKNAIDQIQALEQSNAEVKSLFNSARNNPFQE